MNINEKIKSIREDIEIIKEDFDFEISYLEKHINIKLLEINHIIINYEIRLKKLEANSKYFENCLNKINNRLDSLRD